MQGTISTYLIDDKVIFVKCLRILHGLNYLFDGDSVMVDVGSLLTSIFVDDPTLQFQCISAMYESVALPRAGKMKRLSETISKESLGIAVSDDLMLQCLLVGGDTRAFQFCESSKRFMSQVLTKWESAIQKLSSRILINSAIQDKVFSVGQLWLPKKVSSGSAGRLIHTHITQKNISLLGDAIHSFRPIIVQGMSGCGKSSIIRELAVLTGHDVDLVTLHLNDQSDSKALIGSYICTDVPGEFIWQSGVITQAVINGYWVVIEDIDRVPIDFIGLLSSLLESRQLYLPHHNSPIYAHYNFRIFGTRSIPIDARQEVELTVHNLRHFSRPWHFVTLSNISKEEAQEIVHTKFPAISVELLSKLSNVFAEVLEDRNQLPNLRKQWTLRDYLKIASRMACHSATLTNASGYITNESNMKAFQDIVDVACGSVRSGSNFRILASHVGKMWGLSLTDIDHSVICAIPTLEIEDTSNVTAVVKIGRAKFICLKDRLPVLSLGQTFAQTNYAKRLLEKIAVSVEMNEPILLVGETGSGKTTTIQELARLLGKKLIVQNLSLSTDVSDLLGGYRPVTIRQMLLPAYEIFVRLFQETLSASKNTDFLQIVALLFKEEKWKKLIKAFEKASTSSIAKLEKAQNIAKLTEWTEFQHRIRRYEANLSKIESGFAFHFQKGLLVEAMQHGHWILMDEINLASADTLQGLSGFLDPDDKVVLADCGGGDLNAIERHPDFRIFAAMNPPTDVCKKELPASLRSRFTELYVDEMTDPNDLILIVSKYMSGIQDAPITDIVQVYLGCRAAAEDHLVDGTGQKPRYSLRSLTRSLRATNSFLQMGMRPLGRCLYEAFVLNFQTMLSESCRIFMLEFLKNSLYPEGQMRDLNFPPQRPGGRTTSVDDWSLVKPFWLRTGKFPVVDWSEKNDSGVVRFVSTPTVMINIRTVAAGIAANVAPILLQGPTSIGKTTMVQFLAAKTGHHCVRINNHEHTDVQEYIGSYVTGVDGQLIFQDGLLVQALRNGYWIILDELNLAPSDVLEALNRLLDDNRELLIPETGEIVKPANGFQLFATQNPPGIYGGRKPLSLAFRNRFIEIDLTDLPPLEVEEIITKSCGIAPKFSSMLVKVMVEIQTHRQKSNLLLGKHGTVTTRDLIKWGYRHPNSAMDVAKEGYMLIGEKLRSKEEHILIISILKTVCKVNLNVTDIYQDDYSLKLAQSSFKDGKMHMEGVGGIAITASFKRMWTLLTHAMEHKEPVLLIGETGCGKTMVCQLYAAFNKKNLQIVNCHQSTETSDFVGGLRPVRSRDTIRQHLVDRVNILLQKYHDLLPLELESFTMSSNDIDIKNVLDTLITELPLVTAERVHHKTAKRATDTGRLITMNEEVDSQLLEIGECQRLLNRLRGLFEWEDGSLIKAMKNGDIFLMDEINLAEDAVIERLNSVLEFNREITLAEKGGIESERLHAHQDFRIIATMNPSGDFGKRELSPALRSRFTEIWVPAISDLSEMVLIISEVLAIPHDVATMFDNLSASLSSKMLDFMTWMNSRVSCCINGSLIMTIRETLAWAGFIAQLKPRNVEEIYAAYVHGAFLTILDGLGIGQSISRELVHCIRADAFNRLLELCPAEVRTSVARSSKFLLSPVNNDGVVPVISGDEFRVGIFSLPFGPELRLSSQDAQYALHASSTVLNMGRILRALQIKRPILLEGPPGVGKSSLVTNLAKLSGHKLIRINLSEHSELSDLLGSDLPVPNDTTDDIKHDKPQFNWCDGIFLKAMKEGNWVLLDELNLAPQTVLEGLNACFDHREQVYLPDIGQIVQCAPSFRVFCAQNPMLEGGGRKGLPASFLSRFTRVYMESMSPSDMVEVVKGLSKLGVNNKCESEKIIDSMIAFIGRLSDDTLSGLFGREGFPWEFNLRDIFRWCELIEKLSLEDRNQNQYQRILGEAAYVLFVLRMRSIDDRNAVVAAFRESFGYDMLVETTPQVKIYGNFFAVGGISIPVQLRPSIRISPVHGIFPRTSLFDGLCNQKNIEVLATGVALRWPCLLVGPSGSGKRRCIEYLAASTGNQVRYFSAIPSLDSTEILGSFEQSNVFHTLYRIINDLEHYVMTILSHVASGLISLKNSPRLLDALVDIISLLQTYIYCSGSWLKGEVSSIANTSKLVTDLEKMVEDVWKLIHDPIFYDICKIDGTIDRIGGTVSEIGCLRGTRSQGTFAWENGVIVEALLEGHWLIFDNVNLASSSVLDRLNSVLEPNGSLVLTEDGSGQVIVPHNDFRIFFVMDPNFGEISRAMRNRCVEVYFNPSECLNTAISTYDNLKDKSHFVKSSNYLLQRVERSDDIRHQQGFHNLFPKRLQWELEGAVYEPHQIIIMQELLNTSGCASIFLAAMSIGFVNEWTAAIVKNALKRVQNSPGNWLQNRLRGHDLIQNSVKIFEQYEEYSRDYILFRSVAAFRDNLFHDVAFKILEGDDKWKIMESIVFPILDSVVSIEWLQLILFNRADIILLEWYWCHSNKVSARIKYENGESIPVLALCCLIGEHYITMDSKELFPLRWLYAILTNGTEHILKASTCSKVSIDLGRLLWQQRDILVTVLVRTNINANSLSGFVWDDILIAVKWYLKIFQTVFSDEDISTQGLLTAFNCFFKAVHEIWGSFGNYSKLRLWKECGRPAIPLSVTGWMQLHRIRSLLHSPSFDVAEGINGKFPSIFIRSLPAVHLMLEWVGLYGTFYWACTNELSIIKNDKDEGFPATTLDLSSFAAMIDAFQLKLEKFGIAEEIITISEIQDKLGPMDFHEREGYLFSDERIGKRNHFDRLVRCVIPSFIVAEHIVIVNIHEILEKMSRFYIGNDNNLVPLRSVVRKSIDLALQSTSYDPLFIRELQTLSWCLDSVLAASNDEIRSEKECSLKRLCRIMFNTLDNHLLQLYFHTANSIMNCNVSYLGETMRYIIHQDNHFSDLAVQCSNRCSNRIGDVLKSVSLGLAVKHIDPRLLFPRLQALGPLCPRGAKNYAEINLSCYHDAVESTNLLFFNALLEKAVDKNEISSSLSKLGMYLFDVLWSARDFFHSSVLSIIEHLRLTYGIENDLSNSSEQMISLNLFESIEDKWISSLFLKTLDPLLRKLTTLKECVFSLEDIGFCWSLLGIARFHMMVPQIPIDPGMKPARKANLLGIAIANRELTISSEIKLNCLSGHSPLSEFTLQEISSLQELEDKRKHYKLRSVQRLENDKPFESLFAELQAIACTSLDLDTFIQLVNAVQSRSREKDNFSLQIETLCNTLKSFSTILRTHFFHFEDIIVPILGAIENITRGILLLNHFTSPDPSHSVQYLFECADDIWKSIGDPIEVNVRHPLDLFTEFKMIPVLGSGNSDTVGVDNIALVGRILEITLLDYFQSAGIIDRQMFGRMKSILKHFSDIYLMDLKLRAEKESDKNSWFKYKEGINLDEERDEKLLRSNFPDHLDDLNEYLEPLEMKDTIIDRDNSLSKCEKFGHLDDIFISLVIGIHARTVFLYPNNRWNASFDEACMGRDFVRRSKLTKRHLSKVRHLMLKMSERSIIDARYLNGHIHSLTLLAEMKERLKFCKGDSWFSSNVPDVSMDRDLLLLLEGYHFTMTPEAAYSPNSFHFDENPSEILLAEIPLRRLLDRSSELLRIYPGNEILLKISKLSMQILEYHVTVPVGKMLVALQVLLKCTQEWENYASRQVSIGENISAISSLISKWRTLELKSWEDLLRNEEIVYAKKATKMWFSLYQIFTKALGNVGDVALKDVVENTNEVWERISSISPVWLFTGLSRLSSSKEDAGTIPVIFPLQELSTTSMENCSSTDEYFEYLIGTLDIFLRSSTVGEFPTRLHLVRLMALSLNLKSEDDSYRKDYRKTVAMKFERIAFGVWQYYQQFLPSVRKFQDLLRIPLQQKVKEEVKLGKWDSLNIYALMESSDKIHRKLSKFVKDYIAEVLEFPVHSLLQRELMNGLVNNAGESVAAPEVPDTATMFPQLFLEKVEKLDEVAVIAKKFSTNYDFSHCLNVVSGKESLSHTFCFSRLSKIDSYLQKVSLYFSKWFEFSPYVQQDNVDDIEVDSIVDGTSESLCFGMAVAETAEKISAEIFERIESLRGNSASKPIKLKAVRDLMEILRDHGFSHLKSDIPSHIRNSVESLGIVSTLPEMFAADLKFGFTGYSRDVFEKGEYYYIRNLAELPQLRTQSITPHSKDVSQRDAISMVTFAESMMIYSMRARVVLDAAVVDFGKFSELLMKLNSFRSALKDYSHSSISNKISINQENKVFQQIVDNVARVLNFTIECESIASAALDAVAETTQSLNRGVFSMLDSGSEQILFAKRVSLCVPDLNEMVRLLSEILTNYHHYQDFSSHDPDNNREETCPLLCFQKFKHLGKSLGCYGGKRLASKCNDLLNKTIEIFSRIRETLIFFKNSECYKSIAFALENSVELCRQLISSEESTVKESIGDEEFFMAGSNVVDQSLIIIQRLKRFLLSLQGGGGDFDISGCFGEKINVINLQSDTMLCRQFSCAMAVFRSFKLDNLNTFFEELNRVCGHSGTMDQINLLLRLNIIEKINSLLGTIGKAYRALLDQFCLAYKAHNKLTYIIVRVFRNLLAKGICSNDSEDADNSNSSDLNNMTFEDNIDGTGMGEGQGTKDVSDEIQNEEQLLGNKKDNLRETENGPKDKIPDKQLDKDEKDKGVEMSEEFDGDMYDLPSEEDEQEHSQEDDEGEEPDREMGEADLEDIVDEKQWESDDEGNDENKDQGKEKFEDNSKAKGETLDGEMHTKNDDDLENSDGSKVCFFHLSNM